MRKPHQIIERHWQQPQPLFTALLRPLSRLFQTVYRVRRYLYQTGRLKREKLPVPVAVVGNIHAGGTGKTPITAALAAALQARGIKVGIISRGYGRRNSGVHVLTRASTAADAGDEPLMLYRQTGAPTAVGSRRAEAAKALLAAHPHIELLLADDGLQHYALQRDIEIAVFPAADIGRHDLDLLPNGGLREPLSRLHSTDAVVVSGCRGHIDKAYFRPSENIFTSHIENGRIYRLHRPDILLDTGRLKNRRVAAVAGIAKPERFFQSLAAIGITVHETLALPDHAAITPADLPAADIVIITEKDAVKLADFDADNVWVLPVCAIIQPDLAAWVAGRLNLK
ncbi:tetraacyldisaccharide 4'-kinase [Uruburuella testudinis]|uniref:Tetraacyldisaccharide 4'-kinase n=1 Tax=Uruburuella testudinis TaxID=1282863 RepID=A0ABY4DVV7_9NEIS|nr:tetraacyldisaccharide 4'-kinase [Uruburuella testudinis]UOO82618.1 tetraacyldisaccharide 4'-kinase [Uruburuella testudinis]